MLRVHSIILCFHILCGYIQKTLPDSLSVLCCARVRACAQKCERTPGRAYVYRGKNLFFIALVGTGVPKSTIVRTYVVQQCRVAFLM